MVRTKIEIEIERRYNVSTTNSRDFVVHLEPERSDGAEGCEVSGAGHDAPDREGHRAEAHLEGHPVRRARPKPL